MIYFAERLREMKRLASDERCGSGGRALLNRSAPVRRKSLKPHRRPSEPAMMHPALVLVSLMLWAAAAWAEAPPASGEPELGRVFCDQSLTYRIAEPATVPESYRVFLGPWSDAAWDANTCAALVVENIDPDGTAAIIYAYGPLG